MGHREYLLCDNKLAQFTSTLGSATRECVGRKAASFKSGCGKLRSPPSDGKPGSNRDGKPAYRRNGNAVTYGIAGRCFIDPSLGSYAILWSQCGVCETAERKRFS